MSPGKTILHKRHFAAVVAMSAVSWVRRSLFSRSESQYINPWVDHCGIGVRRIRSCFCLPGFCYDDALKEGGGGERKEKKRWSPKSKDVGRN